MAYELVKKETFGGKELKSVIVEEYIDNPKGMEYTDITINFKDGNFKCISFSREL